MGVVPHGNVSDRLYKQISSLIMSGELEEGYVFPNEAVLCEQLQVGRSTLREAYKALELSGYITRTKRGTAVNSRSTIISATPLRTLFSSADQKDFARFRLMIEPQSAALAAQNAGLKDVESLDRLLEDSKKALHNKDYEELMRIDVQYHTSIAHMSGSPLISSIVTVMAEEWSEGIRRNFEAAVEKNPDIFRIMISQHETITDAIRRRDPAAEQLMEEHIRTVTITD